MEDQKRILIVDDDSTTRTLLSALLQKSGYGVETAKDGLEGTAKAKEFNPHLVLSDVVLPRLDGFAFCRNLRANFPHIAIIMISRKPELEAAFRNIGVKIFLSKPIDTQLLISKVESLIGRGQPIAVEESPPKENLAAETTLEPQPQLQPPLSVQGEPAGALNLQVPRDIGLGRKILILDDEEELLDSTRRCLEKVGFEVNVAVNGREGLAALKKEIPDLIICDVLMPVMDGFAFYKEIKRNAATSVIPVLILTGRPQMEDSFRAIGADHFVRKPYQPETLLSKIRDLIAGPAAKSSSALTREPAEKVVSVREISDQKIAVEKARKKDEVPTVKFSSGSKDALSAPNGADGTAETTRVQTGKKILVSGNREGIVRDMCVQLEQENCRVTIIHDERQIVPEAEKLNPDLVILQMFVSEVPVDETVGALSALKRKGMRENEQKLKKNRKETELFKDFSIVLYKTEEELNVGSSVGAENLAAMEDLLSRCQNSGCSKYIGRYSAYSFISKIKEFLKN